MSAEALERELDRYRSRTPFQPFAIELSDSKLLQIDRVEVFAFRDGTAAAILSDGRPVLFKYAEVSRIIGGTVADQ